MLENFLIEYYLPVIFIEAFAFLIVLGTSKKYYINRIKELKDLNSQLESEIDDLQRGVGKIKRLK